MSSNLRRQPSRIAAYTAEGSYYPRELVEVNGELYLINDDGTRTRVNPSETTIIVDADGNEIASIDPTIADTIELPEGTSSQSGLLKFGTSAPEANGTATAGTATAASRSDHVHPLQTDVSGNAGTATKLKTGNTISISGGATGTATNFDGSSPINIPVTALDATKLSGIIPLACIPKGAQERLIITSTDTTRLALTLSDVQNGDVVKVESTGLMYYVADETKLGTEAAFEGFTAGTASSVAWSNVTGKPTFATVATSGKYTDLSGIPTIPVASNEVGSALGTASAGTSVDFARADHVHPLQTTITGNAATATKLATGVTIGLSGVTATAQNFDGSKGITIPITAVPASIVTGLSTVATSGKYSDLTDTPTIPTASNTTPMALGTAAVGTATTWARADHVHPLQTTITGNAATATKLATGVTIGLSGVTATAQNFDGSKGITIPVTAVPVSIVTGLATVATSGAYSSLSGTPTIPVASSDAPKANGTASAGTSEDFARADHVHPVPTVVGNATSASEAGKLSNPVNIGLSGVTATAQEFDGTADITIPVTAVPASIVTGLADVSKSGSYNDLINAPAIPSASTTTPKAAGTATVGTATTWARADHVHPLQTTISGEAGSAVKLATTHTISLSGVTATAQNFNGTQDVTIPITAVPASIVTGLSTVATSGKYSDLTDTPTIPTASNATPAALGTAAIGTSTAYARADHVHAAPTTVSGNAGSATKLANARTIGLSGVTATAQSFDGTNNITIPITAVPASIVSDLATVATSGKYDDLTNTPIIPVASITAAKAAGTAAAGTSTTYARADHVHPLQTTITGNAATATKLATGVTIGLSGVTATAQDFDGSKAVTIPITAVPASIVTGLATVATSGKYSDLSGIPSNATTSEAGLMSSTDKSYFEKIKAVNLGTFSTSNVITDLQDAILNWLNNNLNTPGASAYFRSNLTWITLWNNNDTETAMQDGPIYTIIVDGNYTDTNYVHLKISSYSDDKAYHLRRNDGTWGRIYAIAHTNSTVEKANKLSNTRYFKISGAASSPSVGFDGSNGVTFNVDELKESYLKWGDKSIAGSVSALDSALYSGFSANRLAYIDPSLVVIEYSTDGGSTWSELASSDKTKFYLTTCDNSIANYTVGNKTSGVTVNDKLRITIKGDNYYFLLRKILIEVNTGGATNCSALVEVNKYSDTSTFNTIGTYEISGWSGWNSIPFGNSIGYSSNSAYKDIRFTFSIGSISEGYSNLFKVTRIRFFGDTLWAMNNTVGGMMPRNGNLYDNDVSGNATFPAGLAATSFTEDGTALSSKYAAISHNHNLLSTQNTNFKQADDLPSTYPQGETIFFSNNPSSAFNNIKYCTIHTIKGYNNMAAIQFLYPYNTNEDTIYYRTAVYSTDAWREWQTISTKDYTLNSFGITATANEINYTSGVKSNIQKQLDDKAESSHGTHVTFTTTAPNVAGTASAGSASTVSRSDHVHPAQTTVSGNAGSADKVNNSLSIQLNSGTATVFDGSAAKTIDITPSAIGAAAANHGTHLSLGETSSTAYRGDRGATAYTHSQAAHAPSNAQKNSDITKAEIEAKLTGTITSHNHSGTYAAASHGNHVPTTQTVNNAVFLRNDNTWATVTPANIGAAASSHGTHVTFATTDPKVAGTASVGSASTVSRSDHVHPAQTISRTYTASIGTTWTGSAAPYTQSITVSGVTATDNPIVDIVLSGTYDTDETALVEYAKIYRITTAANSITVYASEKTESAVNIQLKCVNS